MSADGEAVFTAGGAAGKKRRKKKILVVEDEEEVTPVQPQESFAPAPIVEAAAVAAPEPVVRAPVAAPAPAPAPAPATAAREPDTPPRADSDDEGFNPLAEAMGLSAASVAASARADDDLIAPASKSAGRAEAATVPAASASSRTTSAQAGSRSKPKSSLATSFGSSSGSSGAFRDNSEGGISSFAKPGSARSGVTAPAAAAQAAPASDKDEFDFDDDFDVLGSISASASASSSAPRGSGTSRGGVVATSSGYIDDKDMATIQAARAAALRGKNSQQQQQQAPDDDEFDNLDDVSADLRAVDKLSLAADQKGKPRQFDEFADVWEDAESALKNPAAPPGPTRKVLKASKEQRKVEKPNAKEEARMAAEAARAAAVAEEAAARDRQQQQGLQNPLLAKLGMGPTTILAQYDRPAGSGSASAAAPAPAGNGKKGVSKVRSEQMLLESNDEALAAAAAAASPAAPAPSNVVEALVSAHTASSPEQQPEMDAELQQWGAVNEVREKQLAAAAAEAERVAKQGKSIGIRAADDISRDTPLHYDGALKSLTIGPSAESAAASAAIAAAAESDPSSASSSPRPSTAVQLQLLKSRIQVHDFRNVGFARAARYKLLGPPRLASPRLEDERDLVFCMALMQVDYAHSIDHERMLLTLYRGLTGDALAPPQFGNHWQVIGFQGNDPATDLRGAGLFSVIQLLYFHKQHRELMLRVYQLSLDDRQNFPFCTLSTNITGMVLQALRECYKLYGEINRQGSVYAVVNQLYVAAFYEMFLGWKSRNCTIVDWNETRSALEEMVLRNPKALLKKFRDNQGAGGEDGASPEPLEFTEIP